MYKDGHGLTATSTITVQVTDTVALGDLTLNGVPVPTGTFTLAPGGRSAVWKLTAPFAQGLWTVELGGSIVDGSANPLTAWNRTVGILAVDFDADVTAVGKKVKAARAADPFADVDGNGFITQADVVFSKLRVGNLL